MDLTPSPARVEAFLEPARSGSFTSVLLVSVATTFLLPRQFHMAFTEAPEGVQGERALRTATWAFPLLLLVMNLPIPLVLWAGESLAPSANGDLYVLLVAAKVPWLAPLVWLGGVSASSAMVIVASLALSSMSLTHLVLPWRKKNEEDLYAALLRQRRVVVAMLMIATFLVFLALEQGSGPSRGGALAQIGLVSFCAVLQVVPGVAGVLFLPRVSAHGVLAGLLVGVGAWAALLALPVVGIDGVVLPSWLTAGDSLGVSALISLCLNVLVATVVPCASKAMQTISVSWPLYVCMHSPLSASHSLAVLSKEPVTTRSPYGLLKAMAYTTFLWPSRLSSSAPDAVSHSLHVRS
jgi:Na+/proline symporter